MEFLTYFSSLLSILFIFILVFCLYRGYRIDSFRQKMFCLRDELFDEARKGNIPFDSDAYGMLRSTINGTIRFAHKLSLWQMITFVVLVKTDNFQEDKPFTERFEANLKNLSDDQAKVVRDRHMYLNFLMVEHIVLSSPLILLTFFLPITFFLVAKSRLTRALAPFKSPLDKLDSAVLAIGRA